MLGVEVKILSQVDSNEFVENIATRNTINAYISY